jgi:hypothetical protein
MIGFRSTVFQRLTKPPHGDIVGSLYVTWFSIGDSRYHHANAVHKTMLKVPRNRTGGVLRYMPRILLVVDDFSA